MLNVVPIPGHPLELCMEVGDAWSRPSRSVNFGGFSGLVLFKFRSRWVWWSHSTRSCNSTRETLEFRNSQVPRDSAEILVLMEDLGAGASSHRDKQAEDFSLLLLPWFSTGILGWLFYCALWVIKIISLQGLTVLNPRSQRLEKTPGSPSPTCDQSPIFWNTNPEDPNDMEDDSIQRHFPYSKNSAGKVCVHCNSCIPWEKKKKKSMKSYWKWKCLWQLKFGNEILLHSNFSGNLGNCTILAADFKVPSYPLRKLNFSFGSCNEEEEKTWKWGDFMKSCTGIYAKGHLFSEEHGKKALPAGFMASGTLGSSSGCDGQGGWSGGCPNLP